MPCRDYGYEETHNNAQQDRLDKFARMLCHILTNAEDAGVYGKLIKANNEASNEVFNWWRQHKIDDAEALAQEEEEKAEAKLRKKALKKLNKKEREALGL